MEKSFSSRDKNIRDSHTEAWNERVGKVGYPEDAAYTNQIVPPRKRAVIGVGTGGAMEVIRHASINRS